MAFLWFDFETFGTNPVIDRPCQFAAIRTDDELQSPEAPFSMFCAPANDVLPNPYACLVTGITPQKAAREGVNEAEFSRTIHELMTRPNTCSVGYNNLKFDDEVTRHLFYRNFLDPYEREWKNGNSRWDLINLTRMCYSLRPGGIEWPTVPPNQEGFESNPGDNLPEPRPSFRLEDLTSANGIDHGDAHDALADVRATLELGRLIRSAQPKLFEWSLGLRSTDYARKWINAQADRPFVHTSGRIAAARGCTTLVFALDWHPDIDSQVIVFDLMADPAPLIEQPAKVIEDLVFTPAADLPEDLERLPLKTIKINASPMVAPLGVIEQADPDRIGLDVDRCMNHAQQLIRNLSTIRRKLKAVFHRTFESADQDPELSLYSGGFFGKEDRKLINEVRATSPTALGNRSWSFQDPRLEMLLLRYRARNWPENLDQHAWDRWEEDRTRRLNEPSGGAWYGMEAFGLDLEAARRSASNNGAHLRILDQVEAWQQQIAPRS